MKECDLYEKTENGVRCLACSHKCKIFNGNVGICGVRKNIDGKLFLLVYERLVSMAIDPIEKKPLYKFLPGSKALSIGTMGCNFRCLNCQNFDISQAPREGFVFDDEVSCRDIVKQAILSGCKSIAYTYNEPTIFIEFVKEVSKLAKEKGLKNIWVTNGYMSKQAFEYIKEYVDAMNIDLKSFKDETYKKICGGKLQPVLDTIKRVHGAGIHLEITTLLIPGINDSEGELEKIAKFIASVDKNIVWHISRFFPMYKMKDKPVTDMNKLELAYKIGKKYLNNVYLGNV